MLTVRPTEIAESDVFVCESTYDELKKQIRRNHPGTGLRKFKHSQLVTQDEIYHFKRPIAPAKVKYIQSCICSYIRFQIESLIIVPFVKLVCQIGLFAR